MVKQSIFLILIFCSWSAHASQIEIKTSQGRLNARRDAGFNSRVCGKVRNGAKYEALQEKNGWVQIRLNQRGCPSKVWIHSYYTKEHYNGELTTAQLRNWSPTKTDSGTTTETPPEGGNGGYVITAPDVSGQQSGELGDGAGEHSGASVVAPVDPNLPVRPSGLTDEEYNLCQFYDSQRKILDKTKTENCYKLIKKANSREISKKALIYSLKYLKANLGELQDKRCLAAGGAKGIKNSCQFVVNDLNQRVSGFSNRSPSYFIDLCDGGSGSARKGLITKTYINRGTGSSSNNYTDRSGRKTTVPGAFITGALSPFIPYRVTKAYRNLGWANCFQKNSKGQPILSRPVRDMSKCPVPRLALYGAHNSNNSTSSAKPMHVSPYKSSWGCPSVGVNDRWMLEQLHKNGPSLVINYGPEKYHKDSSINNCRND